MTAISLDLERLAHGSSRSAIMAIAALALGAVAASLWAAPGVTGLLGALLALLMLAIAVIDARLFIIPDELSAAALLLALGNAVLQPGPIWQNVGIALSRAAAVALVFFVLRALYRRLRGRDGLGLGDVKLAGVAGAWLSVLTLPIAIEIAALTALAVFGVRHYTSGRAFDPALKFPFGLFLAPSIWLAWLLETAVLAPF